MDEVNKKDDKKASDEESLKDMRIVLEMYARGFEFLPIDIYRADAQRFQIVDGKIMPALCSISGLGANAAKQIQDAVAIAKDKGGFSSRVNLRELA